MQHVQPELLQRFLADEIDLMERESVSEHLATCGECAALLAQVAADDDALAQALHLDEAEAGWIASVDLTEPVLERIRPWYKEPVTLTILVAFVLLTAYLFAQMSSLIGRQLRWGGPVDFLVDAVRGIFPAVLRLLVYIGQGGLLTAVWPALALTALIWLMRSRWMKKEDKTNA
ncbi:MAG TPA: zf-HC2 domain-containing protein [Symbiobacteriaceae bacterium]|nr:zf-HC2 domain-containing protein [Symbiobacteriaceae bacterium]